MAFRAPAPTGSVVTRAVLGVVVTWVLFGFGDGVHHGGGLVAGGYARAAQPVRLRPGGKPRPAPLRLGEPLGAADRLTVAVGVHADGYRHRCILVAAASAALWVDVVDVDAGMLFTVAVTDRCGYREMDTGGTTIEMCPTGASTGRIEDTGEALRSGGVSAATVSNLNEEKFAAVRKRRSGSRVCEHPFGFGHVWCRVAGGVSEGVVAALGAVHLAVGGSLMALGAGRIVGLLRGRCVKRVLDGFSHEFLRAASRRVAVDRCDGCGYGCAFIA